MSKIVKVIKLQGLHQTYDLEVDHPDHQFFLANGILTSNSHAVSYAFDSYFCAWLFKNHPKEWLCAWLESAEDNPDEKSKAISSVQSYGYKVEKLDINLSMRNWTITNDDKIMPSFKSIKGIGDSAIDEILRNRPYNTLRNFLWDDHGNWYHSKLNKKCMDLLTKLEAFDSMDIVGNDKEIKNYHQLNYILVERVQDLKKHGASILPEVINDANSIEDWTESEKTDFLKNFAGIMSVKHIVDPKVEAHLTESGVLPINTFLNEANDNDSSLVWFVLEDAIPKTTKNGKDYMLFNVTDSSSAMQKVFVWGAKHSFIYEKNKLYICEIKKSDFISTTAWKLKKVDLE